MKKQSNLSRLLDYAGTYRILSYLSWVLAAAGALLALVPFWYIWCILREVIEVAPNYENAVHVTHYGWMAVVFAFAAVLTYIAGLMCSHLAAFRIATNLRLAMTKHIATLPLGEIGQFGSGKLRRTISETTGATETYLAHQLPDKARAVATIAGLLTLLLAFDWRLGLLSLVPVALAFAVMTSMTGKGMQEKMTQYQNALADMSGEAVEYVRGIPVVKTFGQTVFSFKKFKGAIDNYERWVIAYTKQMRWPMTFYTLAVNSVFVFLIAGGFLFFRGGADGGMLLNLLFYIIVTPVISLTLTKLMFMSENGMIVQDAITRIDRVLQSPSLSQPSAPKHPRDSSVELENVTFSYDGTKNAVENISISIGAGQTVAFVGPSGGGKSTLAALIARFFDPQSGTFGALGHGVTDVDTGQLLPLDHGSIMDASVKAVKKGERASPGELKGDFDLTRDSGTLYANTECGIFGKLSAEDAAKITGAALPVAKKDEIKTGRAAILATVSGNETREYDIEIEKIYSPSGSTRNLLLRVTDEELLAQTGGVVQGMSGSAILQDGKIIGAVTHVLLDDPSRGYGIFIENMLSAAGLSSE